MFALVLVFREAVVWKSPWRFFLTEFESFNCFCHICHECTKIKCPIIPLYFRKFYLAVIQYGGAFTDEVMNLITTKLYLQFVKWVSKTTRWKKIIPKKNLLLRILILSQMWKVFFCQMWGTGKGYQSHWEWKIGVGSDWYLF